MKNMRLVLISAALLDLASGFYLPGIAPRSYSKGEDLPIYVNALKSMKTTLPYDYYNPRFHFCRPADGPQPQGESLGSVLMGDRLYNSPFAVSKPEIPRIAYLAYM